MSTSSPGARTNRQIGEFRSRKAVSTQLQFAVRKLEVSSRTAEATKVLELGLIDAEVTVADSH